MTVENSDHTLWRGICENGKDTMKATKAMVTAVVVLLMGISWSFGQQPPPSQGGGEARRPAEIPSVSEVGNRGGVSSIGVPGPARFDVPPPFSSNSETTVNTAPRGGGSATGGSPQIPIQTYAPSRRLDIYSFYLCDEFLYRLTRQYAFFSGYEYLWRYAQGDSPLTPDIVKLALQDSSQAAHSLVGLSEDLKQLLADFEAGRLDRKSFEAEFDRTLAQVRKLAKKIRGDYYLGYIDQRTETKIEAPQAAASLAELRPLVDELHQMALEMQKGLSSFYTRDVTRVVSVQDLAQPSFRSISKGIDRISKTIGKSVDRLSGS